MFRQHKTGNAKIGDQGRLPRPRRKQLESDIEHISQDMHRRNQELTDTNKTLTLLRTIDALVLESHASLKLVCEHITEAIAQSTDYPFIGLLTRTSRQADELTLYGWSGKELLDGRQSLEFSHPIHLKLDAIDWFQQPGSICLVSLDGLGTAQLAHFLHNPEADIKRMLKQVPVKSFYILKLQARRRLVGLLVIGFDNSVTQLSAADTLLMDHLSETTGVALDNKLLFEENQRVLRQLKESNTKLLALDEAKDDFVSMASHQLRTPLTSVKGYLSMVMEGDVGKITPQQRTMLAQAYASSQRMVYIIADLLNVSRLRTGKFVIEATPVNLAQMVAEEVEQLQPLAKGRSLKLSFEPPKRFPELMLDETKTRQVIMNFIDNAIHYTPDGGHINVKLINSPLTVELRVEDNGMGVPRSEQHHLFTKFYRAANARTARPDGTGLGLFMAKKVVIAQGGALIFDSREGQGSTFGFILSKAKLAVPPGSPNPAQTA